MRRTQRGWRAALLALLLIGLPASGCGAGGDTPSVTRVRPSAVPPGGLVLLSGRSFDQVAAVSLDGRELTGVTLVNDEVLALTAPADLAPGTHTLELRAFNGRRALASVNISAPAPAPTPAQAQATPAPVPTAVPTSPSVAPRPSVNVAPPRSPATPAPVRRDGNDDKDKEKEKEKKEERPAERPGNDRGRGR